MLTQVGRLAWDANSYTDLINQVANVLIQHIEIDACAFGRPDGLGSFSWECIAGASGLEKFLFEQNMPILNEKDPDRLGVTGRAWYFQEVVHTLHASTDERLNLWADQATRRHVRSVVAIPLNFPGSAPTAILNLYSSHPGGFSSLNQKAFIAQLRSTLTFACARLEYFDKTGGYAIAYDTRQRWAKLVHTDGVEMHYQPIINMRTGELSKVEALARLRDGDKTLRPDEFFPTLTSDDFFKLYVQGLLQVAQRYEECKQKLGVSLSISLNLPSKALVDHRYYEATRHILDERQFPPSQLTLEILETDALPLSVDVTDELRKFSALGIKLAEDDLGSGHSGLNRLRNLPFDIVKLDRGIVSLDSMDLTHSLHFIYQLTRLGHSLNKTVIIEGVETPDMLEAATVLDVDAVQGYVIARPMPFDALCAWMSSSLPIRLPDRIRPQSTLGKLAALLLWEERLQTLVGQDVMSQHLALPFEVDPTLVRELLSCVLAHGARSAEYNASRKRLMGESMVWPSMLQPLAVH